VTRTLIVTLCSLSAIRASISHTSTKIAPELKTRKCLEMATQTGRVLLTEDKDFGNLVFRTNQSAHGVLLIRLSDLPPREAASLVCDVITARGQDIVGHFAVLTSKALRVRSLEP